MKGQLRLTSGTKLKSPISNLTRPTTSLVREALMQVLGDSLHGSIWLDLFSGSGVMGCEAIQKGAKIVLAIEKNFKTANICRLNLMSTCKKQPDKIIVEVINKEVLLFLRNRRGAAKNIKSEINPIQRFDFVYIDPPYNSEIYTEVMDLLIKEKWIHQDSVVICEHSANKTPKPPSNWVVKDKRLYGNSGLLLLTPPKKYFDDIDSRPPQTSQG